MKKVFRLTRLTFHLKGRAVPIDHNNATCKEVCLFWNKITPHARNPRNFLSDDAKQQNTVNTIKQAVSSAASAASSGGEKEKRRKWWQTTPESKIMFSLTIAVLSFIITSYFDRKKAVKTLQLERVSEKIEKFYGPLYGNRLVQEKTYRAVMGKHGGLRKYLKEAAATKDGEMLRKWRSFVCNILHPLDKEAEILICKNGHLLADQEFPQAFDRFLTHFARLQFVMESWKDEDGKLESFKEFTEEDFLEENNASGDRAIKEIFHHVESKYKELRKAQRNLEVEVYMHDSNENSVTSVIGSLKPR